VVAPQFECGSHIGNGIKGRAKLTRLIDLWAALA
ncbi:MAG: hypothetical protein ACI8YI_002647, partial [Paracoccaceae bacterium]